MSIILDIRYPCHISPRQNVFLRSPQNSKTLYSVKCSKSMSGYCGHFTLVKHIGSFAY